MYLSKINKNGRLYLAVLESYRNSDGRQAKRSIMTIGYLDQTGHDLAYYEQLVVKMNQDKKKEAFQTVRIDMNAPLLSGNNLLNVGYFALKYIYLELGLPAFLSDIQKRSDFKWSLNKNLELLVFSRILFPASKLSTFDNRNIFFEGFDKGVTRDSMYDCLDVLAANKEKIEHLLYKNTRNQYNRDTSTTYYDCTNFYFEIEYNDDDVVDDEGNIIRSGLRKRGPKISALTPLWKWDFLWTVTEFLLPTTFSPETKVRNYHSALSLPESEGIMELSVQLLWLTGVSTHRTISSFLPAKTKNGTIRGMDMSMGSR